MCGIAGFLDIRARTSRDDLRDVAQQMGRSLRHRGPDSGGYWFNESSGIALAHRRLAIIDVSEAGNQPMTSAGGRFVISFNGEIYNHLSIRKALEECARAPKWRGSSDTETMLAAFAAWGVGETLPRLRGMFAFALWDKERRCLYLARDRVGEKPLYYGWLGTVFVFGSELKAVRCHPAWTGELDRGALTLYMRHGYVPAPHSIYAGICKLLPGTLLRLDQDQTDPTIEAYWTLRDTITDAAGQPFRGSERDAIEGLHRVLSEFVAEQMIADVPLGAFLSGGIDSSTIVALMQAQSRHRVRTFTIGFHEKRFDEAAHARAIARHLGTDHTELYVTPEEAIDAISLMPQLYDEPFGDSSQLPTFLLARLAAKDVTVALSGDGGDELFAGYEGYERAETLLRTIEGIPSPLRDALRTGVSVFSPRTWDMLLRPFKGLVSGGKLHRVTGEKLHRWGSFMSLDRPEVFRRLASQCLNPGLVVRGGTEPPTAFTDPARQNRSGDFLDFMMALDLVSYLPDDILVKVDRAAMGVSLETRVPLLDPRVIRYAWSLPREFKVRSGKTKWALRQVLYRYVPSTLIDRPKKGFAVPIEDWLRGPLRDWAESLLDDALIRKQGVLEPKFVAEAWDNYLTGDNDATSQIWNMLMFQAWSQDGGPMETERLVLQEV